MNETDKKGSWNRSLGLFGEEETVRYLQRRGYRILCRNYRCRFGEIDIIAEETLTDTLCFIEVKTRSGFQKGRPCEAVNETKMKHIKLTAYHFLSRQRISEVKLRVDVAEIVRLEKRCYIRYTKNVTF